MASASPPPPSSSNTSGETIRAEQDPSPLRAEDREQLEALTTDPLDAPKDTLRALLEVGRTTLEVQTAYLSQINPGRGTHRIVAMAGHCASLREDDVSDLSTSYCRSILAENDLISLYNAPQEGWADDRAYQTHEFSCYVGTKVLVDGQLYGTVCFADPEARPEPFSDADHALVEEISRRAGQCLRGRPPTNPQAELERSRDFHRRVQSVSRVGGWEIDLTTQELHWTEMTYNLYELPFDVDPDVETAIGYFAEEAQPKLRAALDRCATEGIPYDLRLPLTTAKDTRRWVRVRGVAHSNQGTITRITGTIEDITSEHEAQQALREEHHRFETLFHNLPTPVARCRVEENTASIMAINDAFEDVFGVSTSSVEGTDLNALLVPEVQDESAQALTKRALQDGTLKVETTHHTPDGPRYFRLQVAGYERPDAPPEVYTMYTDITELKEREQIIREERDLLNRIFETSPTAIVVLDAEGNFIRASNRAQEILGVPEDEILDRTYDDLGWDIQTPTGEPIPDHELPFARVKNTGEPLRDVELDVKWPDGSHHLLSTSGAPLYDSTDTFLGAVFHLDDITQRRETRRSLEKSERRFRGVFENAALGIALLDETGHFLNVNPALASMVGRSSSTLRGRHFDAISHPEDRVAETEMFERVLNGERKTYMLETRYVRSDDSSFWGHLTVSRLNGPDQVQAVAMIQDIDIRKTQREELRKFETVVKSTHEAVLILDEDLRTGSAPPITYANARVESLTGYAPQEVIGNSLQWIFGEGTERWVLHDLWTHLDEGQGHEGEAVAFRKDGTPFVARWSISPVYGPDAAVTHWVAMIRDVTEQRQMDKRLLEVQDEERRRIDQELHDEIGGLLTTLQMTVELGRMEAQQAAAPTNRFDEIEEIVTQVSSVTRTVSRRLYPKDLNEHGLSKALRTHINNLQEQRDLAIDLQNDLSDGERLSTLVEMTIYRVVQEALLNVIRHAETDQAHVRIQKDTNNLTVSVLDDGMGFDPAAYPKDDAYGLQAIRERVERLNGTFTLASAEREGTFLTVTLPRAISSLNS